MHVSLFLTLLLMGLTGGLHCAAMCGGLVVAGERAMLPSGATGGLAGAREQVLWPARRLLWRSAQLQLGRVLTYGVLGLVAGAIGSGLWAVQLRPLQLFLYFLGNAVLAASGIWLVLAGLRREGSLQAPHFAWAAVLRTRLGEVGARALRGLLPLDSLPRRLGAGLLWGLLPCGLVYSALSLALLSASAPGGALGMLAFGVGTLPHMLLAGHLLRRFSQRATARAARLGAGGVLLAFALWGLWRLAQAGGPGALHGYCA